jgi:hypothetical protein
MLESEGDSWLVRFQWSYRDWGLVRRGAVGERKGTEGPEEQVVVP